MRWVGRVVAWALTLGYFGFAVLLLTLRYAVLPQIENYRSDIEQLIAKAIDRPVGIRQISAHWEGLRPALTLNGFEIRDAQGKPALGFEKIEAALSWTSLLHLDLRLARLELDAPNLVLRRDDQGRLFAASLEITPQPGDGDGFADWLLVQDRIVIRNASIVWLDDLRRAPPLELKRLNIQLDNSGSRHRVGLTAEPPQALAARLDLRGDFKGSNVDQIETWKGEAYAELDYADLAGWLPWVDYPVALPQGSGALRLWLGFANQQLTSATADIRLADVRLKLRPDLPELDLTRLDGRLAGRRLEDGFQLQAQQLTLATPDGLTIQPTDINLEWHAGAARKAARGKARANGLDLDVLARLAAHLPLNGDARERLARHAPRGRFFDLELDWASPVNEENAFALETWQVSGRFEGLGLTARGLVPGLSGVNGRLTGSQKGGSLHIDGKAAALELPLVFAEPKLEFDAFDADLSWKATADGLQVNLNKANFQNKDLAGEASGVWNELADGPGRIDLSARLSRARGDAVWRYLPLVAGKFTQKWLHESLIRGTASDTVLKLKGDLRQFPFRSRKGEKPGDSLFEVRGKLHDVTLRYAPDWPDIEAIEGDLLFAGERMLITGKSGKVFGVALHDVAAEIADIELANPHLAVKGRATGPTADFLRFIEASPVGEQIENFTDEMKADGNGELDIHLNLPLETLDKSKIAGSYRFDGNRLVVDKDLPALTDVRGQLSFSSEQLEAKGLHGLLLGTPLVVDIKTLGAGNVQVQAAGEITVAGLRQQFPSRLFDHLSGGLKWTGQVRVRKKSAEVKISSNLIGLSSSLPEPFNKTAIDPMAFSFERKPPPEAPRGRSPKGAVVAAKPALAAARDMIEISLGRVARMQLIRQHDVAPPRIVRGLVSVGEPTTTLPERGVVVAVNLPRVNLDFWRGLLMPVEIGSRNSVTSAAAPLAPQAPTPSSPLLASLPAINFDLRANDLIVQDKNFHDIRITGSRGDPVASTANAPATTPGNIRFDLKSRELAGNFEWNSAGNGKLTGRIGQFAIPATATTISPDSLKNTATDVIKQMPALDITVDQLSIKDRQLGTMRLTGENLNDYWHSRIDLKNDDGSLEVSGRWRPSLTEPDTQLEFKLVARSIERMLNRIGYPDAVRRGAANATAKLSWSGSPFAIDYPSLSGKLTLGASNGQFSKLEPGVGRLLGILSLQSLPRRITLDFRDVFSQGFAFDSIDGEFTIANGVMTTVAPRQLHISGPAAKVVMDGSINLGHETQNLHVRIQPAVGESIAVGAMLANPVIGAAVWAAQKLLNNPLDQAFAFDYMVSGSWADPKVEKLGNTAEKANKPESTSPKK